MSLQAAYDRLADSSATQRAQAVEDATDAKNLAACDAAEAKAQALSDATGAKALAATDSAAMRARFDSRLSMAERDAGAMKVDDNGVIPRSSNAFTWKS